MGSEMCIRDRPWTGVYFNDIDIPIEAIAKEGFIFSGWSTNVNSIAAATSINLSENVTITAIFVPEGDTIGPLNQFIDFQEIADKVVTDEPFEISVIASSGLPVELSIVSGPATISGDTITLDGTVGTVLVQASQDGNEAYNPATTVSQFFEVIEAVPPPDSNEIIPPPTAIDFCSSRSDGAAVDTRRSAANTVLSRMWREMY